MVKNLINNDRLKFLDNVELADLHAHLGASLSATELWEMAHDQGLQLPTKNFRAFEQLVSIDDKKDLDEQLLTFDLTEKIQSSPEAMFYATQHVISEAYRKNNITTIELRFNPIFRCQDGAKDMDHILVFALQGMERAMLKYPVKAGLILMMDRRLPTEKNEAIVKKAIKYHHRGVVAIDMGGPTGRTKHSREFKPSYIKKIVQEAKAAGLGLTFHTGEATDLTEMWAVLRELQPQRIGHGVRSVDDPQMLDYLREREVVLELCPQSNIHTKTLADYADIKRVLQQLKKFGVKFTINTDWPATLSLSLRQQIDLLLQHRVLTEAEILASNQIAQQVTFIK